MAADIESSAGRAETGPSQQDYAALRVQLVRSVGRVCPRWLAGSKEDLVQAALIRVMQVERRSEGPREFSASYLHRVAYSALVDEIRRRRARREDPLDDDNQSERIEAEGPGPEDHSAGKEIGAAIQDCLARLIRPRRLAVALNLQGHTVPEAARLLGWTVKRAENLVYRGLRDLRGCLTEKGVRP